jgi:arylsulfatase A-like enzyme
LGEQSKRPNILIYFIDELNADSLGCYGHPFVRTPHMDRIAGEGMQFTRAISNCPLCMPARNSFHTGLYPSGHGILFNVNSVYADERRKPCIFGEMLRQAGYGRIVNVGKHHTGYPADNSGYTENYPIRDGRGAKIAQLPRGGDMARDEAVIAPGTDPQVLLGGDYCGEASETEPYRVADRAIELLDGLAAENDRPWLLRASFIAPHTPVLAPKPYAQMYVDEVSEWEPRHDPDRRAGLMRRWNEMRGFDRLTTRQLRKIRTSYYGLVSLVDDQIGRIEAELKRHGLDDNLLTLLVVDHGSSIGIHGTQVKGPFDTRDIARVPLLIRYPGLAEIGRYDGLVQIIDLLPTLGELLGIGLDPSLPGKSLAPVLRGSQQPLHEAVFSEGSFPSIHTGIRESIRTLDYLYTRYPEIGEEELFDLRQDPDELVNVADERPEMARQLSERLSEWRSEHPLHPDMFNYTKPAKH